MNYIRMIGAEDEIRTRDPRLAKAMLYPCATSAFWSRQMDSNHRRLSQRIYSPPPLATRASLDIIQLLELAEGLEPPTC